MTNKGQRCRNPLMNVGISEKDTDCVQQISSCPACHRDCTVTLMLPCSHTMCAGCVAAGGGTRSAHSLRHSASRRACSLLCPRCQHEVELPCWSWSAATSCLPKHPSMTPARVDEVPESEEGASEDQHMRRAADPRYAEVDLECVPPVNGALDLREEEMEQSVFGLTFALDVSTVPPSLRLSNSSLTITFCRDVPLGDVRKSAVTSDPGVPPVLPRVLADVVITRGQYYWEVDVCNSSIYGIGVTSLDGTSSWWLERRSRSFCAVYDGRRELLNIIPPHIKTLGVFLNLGGGALSFHNPLTQEHLVTLPTRFGHAGVLPALALGQGRLKLRPGLPPPAHVFLSRDSAYRGPRGSGGTRWNMDAPFRSVRKVIQKFEELAASDSDSGLVSGSGSSCSTLASLPDLRSLPSGHTEQETE